MGWDASFEAMAGTMRQQRVDGILGGPSKRGVIALAQHGWFQAHVFSVLSSDRGLHLILRFITGFCEFQHVVLCALKCRHPQRVPPC